MMRSFASGPSIPAYVKGKSRRRNVAAKDLGSGSKGLGGPRLLADGVAVAAGRRDGQVGGPLGHIVVVVWAAVVHGRC